MRGLRPRKMNSWFGQCSWIIPSCAELGRFFGGRPEEKATPNPGTQRGPVSSDAASAQDVPRCLGRKRCQIHQRSRSRCQRCQREPPPVPGAPWGPATPEAQLEFHPKINRCHHHPPTHTPSSAFPAFCGFWDAQPASHWHSLAGSGSGPQNPSHRFQQQHSIPGESLPFSRPWICFPGLKLKEKQLPTSLGNFNLLERRGWVCGQQPLPGRRIFLKNQTSLRKSSPSNHVIRRGKRLPRRRGRAGKNGLFTPPAELTSPLAAPRAGAGHGNYGNYWEKEVFGVPARIPAGFGNATRRCRILGRI